MVNEGKVRIDASVGLRRFAALTDLNPLGLDAHALPREEAELFQGIAWAQYAEDRAAERK